MGGTGEGSCAAPPFRAGAVKWVGGCPPTAPCCSEYGYCQQESNWQLGVFRDCNGVSNGTWLPAETIAAENAAAAHGDARAAGILGVPAGVSAAGIVGAAPGFPAAAAVPAPAGVYAAAAPAGFVGAAPGFPAAAGVYGAAAPATFVAGAPAAYAAAPAAYASGAYGAPAVGYASGAYGAPAVGYAAHNSIY